MQTSQPRMLQVVDSVAIDVMQQIGGRMVPAVSSIGATTDGAVLQVHGFSDEALQPPGAHSRGIRFHIEETVIVSCKAFVQATQYMEKHHVPPKRSR